MAPGVCDPRPPWCDRFPFFTDLGHYQVEVPGALADQPRPCYVGLALVHPGYAYLVEPYGNPEQTAGARRPCPAGDGEAASAFGDIDHQVVEQAPRPDRSGTTPLVAALPHILPQRGQQCHPGFAPGQDVVIHGGSLPRRSRHGIGEVAAAPGAPAG